MISKVDWLSFTIKLEPDGTRQSHRLLAAVSKSLAALSPSLSIALSLHNDADPGPGRKPYSMSLRWPETFVTLFMHPALDHALFEISGQGCELLEESDLLTGVLECVKTRLTRLDVATDILTEVRPRTFVECGYSDRFKSHAEMTSSEGETCYIGGRKSDRFARVYRYNPPHERSHLLRVEVQLKKENAKLAAETIIDKGVIFAAAALGNSFAWRHPTWAGGDVTAAEMQAWTPERHQGKTEYWLAVQVTPAILKVYAGRPDDFQSWSDGIRKQLVAQCDDM